MMKKFILLLTISTLVFASFALAAETSEPIADIDAPVSATKAEGLEAFSRIYEVTSHPRCANCHVGDDNRPRWSGPSYAPFPVGQDWRYHGMNINAIRKSLLQLWNIGHMGKNPQFNLAVVRADQFVAGIGNKCGADFAAFFRTYRNVLQIRV